MGALHTVYLFDTDCALSILRCMEKKTAHHIRTSQILIRKGHAAFSGAAYACQIARRIKNATNFLIQHNPDGSGKLMPHSDADKWLKTNNRELYTKLPSALAQRSTQIVGQEWKSFTQSLKTFKKSPEKFKERPKKPRYANRATTLHVGRNGFRFEKGTVYFANNVLPPIQTRFSFTQNWNAKVCDTIAMEIRIVPTGSCFALEIIYNEAKLAEAGGFCLLLSRNRKAGIDLGINNLIAIASDQPDVRPALINGRPVKSINAWYNKRVAKLRSLKKYKHIGQVSHKRNRAVKDFLHRASRHVVRYCVDNDIGTVVIGKNPDWKQGVKMGAVNNQRFVGIPHAILINMLTYKLTSIGVKVVIQEESYTSKASALDNDAMPQHKKTGNITPIFSGKRIKRGLYRYSKGIINADINAALNILRKATNEPLLEEVCRGLVHCPVRHNVRSLERKRTRREEIRLAAAA